jgi:hypothetical protein
MNAVAIPRLPEFDESTELGFAVDEHIPPGYRLTAAARDRLFRIAEAHNRHERRALMAFFRKHPIKTFERDIF